MKLLVVEDSSSMRSYLMTVIESGAEWADLEIVEASTGFEALKTLPHHKFDAILTDINMPGVDGEELLRRLAADEILRNIPAIVISTDATPNRIERLLALGARGYVTKPFRPESLRAVLERTLGDPGV